MQTRSASWSALDNSDIRRKRLPPATGTAAPTDLPRERLVSVGAEGLRDHELLAVVLGTGYKGHNVISVAREILASHP